MEFTTVKDVELLSVGMKWKSVSGDLTFTFEHLADAARAANEDPHVVAPRLKVGHSDPRFADPDDPGHDPFFDGEPSLGSVRNLRLINGGSILIGDYTDVPLWLAEMMPTAYPSRSIEGGYQVREGAAGELIGDWDVTTPGGKHYSFVLTACALLGVSRPAVENLDDLRRYLVEGQGVVVAGAAPAGGQPVAATLGTVPVAPTMSADVESVIDSFCSEISALSPEDPRYWWWPIAMEADSGTVIADDDEGGLQAIPFTTDADQNVSFSDPYPVIKRYEAAPVTAALAAALLPGTPDVIFRSVRETPLAARHEGRDTEGSPELAHTSGMDFSTLSKPQRGRLLVSLSLPEDATDEQITEALDAPVVEETDEEKAAREAEEAKAAEDAKAAEEAPVASAADATTVTVDKAVWEQTVANGKLAVDLSRKAVAKEHGEILQAAIMAGKIMPSSKADWATKLAAAPEATAAELDKLAGGLVPVTETGGSPSAEASASDVDTLAAGFVGAWFPDHATQQEAV